MIAPRHNTDQGDAARTRELEAQVARLNAEVRHLRQQARVSEGDHVVSARPTWLSRCALVVLTLVLGAAAMLTLDFTALQASDVMQLNEQLASTAMPYPLLVVTILVVLALGAYVIHLRFLFPALASLAIYLAYAFYLLRQPARWPFSDSAYFWFSLGLLVSSYTLFSLAMAWEVRHTVRGRRRLVFVAIPQSIFFFVLAWISIHYRYPGQEWGFLLAFAVESLALAWLSDTHLKARNLLSPLFRIQAVVLANIALFLAAPPFWIPVAMAFEGLLIAAWYCVRPENHLKAVSFGLLVAATYLAVDALRVTTPFVLGEFTVPAHWFIATAVPALFGIIAAVFEHHGRAHEPAWTAWDPRNNVISLLHAAAGAFILILVAIAEQGDSPALPIMLCLIAVPMGGLGWLLRTPQIEAGAAMVLLAGHVSFYFFRFTGNTLATDYANSLVVGIAMALFTLFVARRWERYLNRFRGGHLWEHEATAALPYVAAAVQLSVLLTDALPDAVGPFGLAGLALVLIFCSMLFKEPVLRTAGVVVLLIGGGQTAMRMASAADGAESGAINVLLLLAVFVLVERALRYTASRDVGPIPRRARILRTIVLGFALTLALLATSVSVSDRNFGLAWLGIACAFGLCGIAFRDRLYALMALGAVIATLAWYGINGLRTVDGMLVVQLVGVTVLAVGLAVASLLISSRRIPNPFRPRLAGVQPIEKPTLHG